MFLDVFLGKGSLGKKFVNVDLQSRFLALDNLVHPWLSETRLIRFIVALLSITDDINDDIRLELLSPVCRELMNKRNGFRIITVDMENRTIIGLADISCIRSGSSETRIRSKPNLVVNHNMNRSATILKPMIRGHTCYNE